MAIKIKKKMASVYWINSLKDSNDEQDTIRILKEIKRLSKLGFKSKEAILLENVGNEENTIKFIEKEVIKCSADIDVKVKTLDSDVNNELVCALIDKYKETTANSCLQKKIVETIGVFGGDAHSAIEKLLTNFKEQDIEVNKVILRAIRKNGFISEVIQKKLEEIYINSTGTIKSLIKRTQNCLLQ